MPTSLVDTHQHLIYPDHFTYPWIDEVPDLQASFTLEDYANLTKGYDIEKSLFMEVVVADDQIAAEAHFFSERAEDSNHSLCGVIASARLDQANFSDYLDQLSTKYLKGIRQVLHVVDSSIAQTSRFSESMRILADRKLPFDLCIFPYQSSDGIHLVDTSPNTRIVLDHCGNANINSPKEFANWKSTVQAYAERPNVCVKLSGIIASGKKGAVTLEDLEPYLNTCLDLFGPDRLVWGSDWPVCTLTTSLPEWITLFRSWLEKLSESEQSKIGHENAHCIYGI